MDYFCPKSTFLQITHIQRIYPTSFSTNFVKIYQISYVILEIIRHFSWHNSSVFSSSSITYFLQKQPIKVQFIRLSTAPVKIHQIPHVTFQTKSQFFFKVLITLQCHERSFFCTFLAETFYAIDQSSPSKCKSSDLPLLALKLTKFLM